MKKFLVLLAALGFLILHSQSAMALSTEQASGQNSDGSPKFADPDEQMPNFMTGTNSTNNGEPSGLQPLALDSNQVTPPTPGEYDSGAAAFNQAYSHLQNR